MDGLSSSSCPNACGLPYLPILGHLSAGMQSTETEERCVTALRRVVDGPRLREALRSSPSPLPTQGGAAGISPAVSLSTAGHPRPVLQRAPAAQASPHPGLRGVAALADRAAHALMAVLR